MDIEFRNWDKYNPKRDQKYYSWLRLSNDLITCPDLHDFESLEKYIWVLVLCEASKKNKARVKLNIAWMSAQSKIDAAFLVLTVQKFATHGFITIHDSTNAGFRSCAVVDVKTTTPTNERTYGRTNGRTDVLELENDPTSFTLAEIVTTSELNGFDISSQLTGIRKKLEAKSPVRDLKQSSAISEGQSMKVLDFPTPESKSGPDHKNNAAPKEGA